MRTKFKKFKVTFVALLFACIASCFSPVIASPSLDPDTSTDTKPAINTLIQRLYVDELGRKPTPEELNNNLTSFLANGKNEQKLKEELYKLPESRMHRAKRYVLIFAKDICAAVLCMCCIFIFFGRTRLARIKELFHQRYPDHYVYFTRPITLPPPFGWILLILCFYLNFKIGLFEGIIIGMLCLGTCVLLFRPSRWAANVLLMACMFMITQCAVLYLANGLQDVACDRDEAVEIATSQFLEGKNPWDTKTQLQLPITTGPSSIFLAVPFVLTTGKIDNLSLILWLLFFVFLFIGDMQRRNNSLPGICLLLFLPVSGFFYTLMWGLDELYYAAILSPVMWIALKRKKNFFAGLYAGFMLLSRPSYLFAVLAIGAWWLQAERRNVKDALSVFVGSAFYIVLSLGIFWLIGGTDFLHNNFLLNAQIILANDSSHIGGLSFAIRAAIALLAVLATCAASIPLRRLDHPFYHVALAMLLAHTFVFAPPVPESFVMLIVIPACYGAVFQNRRQCIDTHLVDS